MYQVGSSRDLSATRTQVLVFQLLWSLFYADYKTLLRLLLQHTYITSWNTLRRGRVVGRSEVGDPTALIRVPQLNLQRLQYPSIPYRSPCSKSWATVSIHYLATPYWCWGLLETRSLQKLCCHTCCLLQLALVQHAPTACTAGPLHAAIAHKIFLPHS